MKIFITKPEDKTNQTKCSLFDQKFCITSGEKISPELRWVVIKRSRLFCNSKIYKNLTTDQIQNKKLQNITQFSKNNLPFSYFQAVFFQQNVQIKSGNLHPSTQRFLTPSEYYVGLPLFLEPFLLWVIIRVNQNIIPLQYLNHQQLMIRLEHKKIGDYIVFPTKKVAQLKHSAVILGVNTKNKQKVLVKTISKAQYENNDVLMNSLNFQLDAMNSLKQENILKAIQLITTQKNYYLILEEPQGKSFKKIMTKNGTINEKQLRGYLKLIIPTFKALQKNNIIHGNINSKSVLIDHGRIKLGYPSYVKTIEIMKTNSLNDSLFVMGENLQKQKEYAFLPPELLATGKLSFKHDIWSFGVVVYQALFGRLPWDIVQCSSPFEMASLIAKKKIEFPKDIRISKCMKHFIANCLETNPEERFGWEQVLEHTVFTSDTEGLDSGNTDEQEASSEQVQACYWQNIQKMVKSQSTFTQ